MAVSTFGRPGLDGTGTAPAANLLKVFAGEVITNFQLNQMFLGLTQMKNVSGGAISWDFPVVGGATVSYHTAGSNVLTDDDNIAGRKYLKKVLAAKRTVHMDKSLVAPVFFDRLDEKLSHYDYRGKVAGQLGEALARTVDMNIQRLLWACGLAAGGATITGGYPVGTFGSTSKNVGAFSALTSAALVKSLSDMKIAFDNKLVPRDGRFATMAPDVMARLFIDSNSTIPGLQWVDRDFSGMPVSNGSFKDGKVPHLFGFTLLETPNSDFGAVTETYGPYDTAGNLGGLGADDGVANTTNYNLYDSALAVTNQAVTSNNDYTATYNSGTSTPIALCFQQEAIGTVKLEDLSVESEYMIEYRGSLVVASMTLGHGILRPECIGVIGDLS